MKKINLLTVIVIGTLVMSMIAIGTNNISAQQEQIETNFTLKLITNVESRTREAFAFYFQQAFAPLGINVKIIIKPFGQFVGDLLHATAGEPWDLAIVTITDGGLVPGDSGIFSTTPGGQFPCDFYQLCGEDFQKKQLADTGVNQTEDVDKLLLALEFENDMLEAQKLSIAWQKLFNEKLLYTIPDISYLGANSMWKGFGGTGNELWDPQLGHPMYSVPLGATWESNQAGRQSNLTTLVDSTTVGNRPGDLDNRVSIDTATTDQWEFIYTGLLDFDGGNAAHPGLALQYWTEDWVNPQGDLIINGNFTYILNTDLMWPAALDYTGATIPADRFDANDVAFTLKLAKLANELNIAENPLYSLSAFRGWQEYDKLLSWDVRSTVSTDDTIVILWNQTKPETIFNQNQHPYPSHILDVAPVDDGLITYFNDTETDMLGGGMSPYDTAQWANWRDAESGGWTGLGRMRMVEYALETDGFMSYSQNPDYWYPNEWDTANFYDANTAVLDKVYANANTTKFKGANLGIFAPQALSSSPAYFWSFAGTETNRVKPTSQGIEQFIFKVIPTQNAQQIAFEAGLLDDFAVSAVGIATVVEFQNNDDYETKETTGTSRPYGLNFNMLGEFTGQYQIRLAMGKAIDQSALIDIRDGFGRPWGSILAPYWETIVPTEFKGAGPNGVDLSWVTQEYDIGYSYEDARDIMRSLGFKARQTPNPVEDVPKPPVTKVIGTIEDIVEILDVGSDILILFTAFALISVVSLKRYRRKM